MTMPSHQQYIYHLNPQKIYQILHSGAWMIEGQQLSSAETNTASEEDKNHIEDDNTEGIYAFADIDFNSTVRRMLDIGGGKYNWNKCYMKQVKNINLLVWDPYNRSIEHNDQIKKDVKEKKADAVTSMSVLNVISECEVRLAHIATVKDALVANGLAYFKVWPGNANNISATTENSYQSNSFAIRFLNEVEMTFGSGNAKMDSKVPNLIIAIKKSEDPTPLSEIVALQKKLKKENPDFSLSGMCFKSLLASNLGFFKQFNEKFVEENRHLHPSLQTQWDKKFGLVVFNKK